MLFSTRTRQVIAALLVAGSAAGAATAQTRLRFQWWHSEEFQKALSLSTDQVERVDGIFQAVLPELRQRKQELDRLELHLSKAIEADADEAAVGRIVDKTEAARSALNKVRTLMLVRMRQVLTPEQRERFSALHAERQHNREARRESRARGER
jgi:Spy/CpxP family protein refolding chaperone